MTTAVTAPLSVDYGHAETVSVHFDDLDVMGVVHNGRYTLLLERALAAFWRRHGHAFDEGRLTTPDVFNVVKEFSISYHTPIRTVGDVVVHFWIEQLGESSGIYAFRLVSPDGRTEFAEGRRVVVKLDPRTLRPAPWTAGARAVAQTLLR